MASEPLKIKVEGVDQAINDIRLTELRKRGALMRAVVITAVQGTARMKRFISQPGTGNWYGSHRASAPGQPPAVDTGQYRASWTQAIDLNGMGASVQTDQIRAPFLEYGTRRMAARPHAGPVSDQMKGDWIKNVKDALD